ncbi:Flp pilus assembly protein TadD [Sphingomonas jejuensis]|uniref:Flp pilus assembly protein TadD n=1 Tax=Sphingomonas jejuensis TaxID=904715 RepID=A0ABX0XIS4_9SPHN|nr:SPOR domain-containing protein [Sphingomonas jejuensis]NJC33237.1 Flp pilus assembly protein TadD [Sphingomonas jejuensis]
MCAIAIFTRAAVSSLLLASTMIASTSLAGELPAGQASAIAADRALAAGDGAAAVAAAEEAVARSPDRAHYRTLLGRAYLASGRYRSAETAFTEALTLETTDGRAAGGLVLCQLALGRPGAARASLGDYARIIQPTDLGLLVALAGDPATGIMLLEQEARRAGGSPRLRQNLSLAYALAGRWPDARAMAAADLGDEAARARMLEWSAATGPAMATARIAAMTAPAAPYDPGRPVALALGAAPAGIATAAVEPTGEAKPLTIESAPPAPIQFAGFGGVQFAPRREVVQALPANYRSAAPTVRASVAVAIAAAERRRQPRPSAAPSAQAIVQIGAFASPALARMGWETARRRMPELARFSSTGATLSRPGATLYRLGVSGFAGRGEAVALCERFRRTGGSCFVRQAAGDRPLEQAFAPQPVRMAAR